MLDLLLEVFRIGYFWQLWMALSASTYMMLCSALLGRELPPEVYGAAALWTWAVYIWDAAGKGRGEDKDNQPDREKYLAPLNPFLPVLVPAAVLGSFYLLRNHLHDPGIFAISLLVIGAGIGYTSLSRLSGGRFRNLKEIGTVKTLLVSGVWAVGGVGYTMAMGIHAEKAVISPGILLLIVMMLLSYDALIADLRDLPGDQRKGIQTLAALLPGNPWRACWWIAIAIALAVPTIFLLSEKTFDGRGWIIAIMTGLFILGVLTPGLSRSDEVAFGIRISLWRMGGGIIAGIWIVLT